MKKIVIILLLCFSNILFAEMINIPNDFSSIQSGINQAQTGDTILVQRGSYIENIDFTGKNVVVTSLFIISNDPEDIKQTIIDGDRRGSVVTIDKGESSKAVLCGFTITSGLSWNGGGINCSQSSPVLKNLLIKNNEANGLGGGVELYHANASLINVKIIENTAHLYGGGINCNYSDPYLENVTITQNKSYESGGGILFWNCNPIFSNENRCNIYFNTAVTGSDLCVELEAPVISVVLDTFTVLNPTSFFVEPFDNFNFDILNSKIEQSNADLYVSPTGNNNNNGLSPDQPMQTIGVALAKIIADSSNPHTIYLADGIYTPTNTGEHFPLKMVSFVSINGQSRHGTIIDAENQSNVLVFNHVLGSELKNLTITKGYSSRGIQSSHTGGGIYCENSNPVLENIILYDNYTYADGGGIFFENSNPTLINTIVKKNKALGEGGGIYFRGTHGSFENCLIKENKADRNGGGIMLDSGIGGTTTKAVLQNTTITNNSALNRGGGIFLHHDENDISVFDSLNRCNIYLNHAGSGADLYCQFEYDENSIIPVYVDTFSISQPTDFFAAPLEGFSFYILNSKFEQTDDDLYVNPIGDNNNSGLTPDESLRTISFALSKIVSTKLKPNTIYLADGIYSPSNNGEIYPLTMTKYISIVGESQNDVVLDAENLTNVMVFDRDSSISIIKITITGGGNVRQGGGIYSINSEFNLTNITLRNNQARYGGGIYIVNSNVNMEYVTINDNSAVNYGGGISIWYSGGIFKNVDVFSNNVEKYGAGIDVTGSCEPYFSKINIYKNHALREGGGLSLNGASPIFDDDQRCSIYLNNAPVGSDISLTGTSIDAILDTFTVITPTDHYASPLDSLTFDILNAVIQPVDSNLYVSPAGDNSNPGLSKEQPLKTISHALDLISADSLNPKTIFIESGIYSPSTNGEVFPLGMRNYVSLNGTSVDEVILDAENKSMVFNIVNKKRVTLENLTITKGFSEVGGIFCHSSNSILKNVKIVNNTATGGSGGISFIESNPVLENVEISGNKTSNGYGGALSLENSDAHLTNVAILKNTAGWNGGGIFCWNSNPVLINSTISENTAGYRGGGIYCSQSNPVLINTILWNNWPDEVFFEDGQNSNLVTYSNIRSGKFGIITNNNGNVNWAEGNLSEQPLFVNPDSGNFNLQENSPLINKGIAFLVWKGDTIVNIPDDAYFGNAPDMGAFESTFVTKIDPDPKIPALFSLRQNYPNPFNPITTIEYQIAKSGLVKIEIFDILGRRVKVHTNGYRTKGYHRIKFEAGDLSSGIYFYKIISGKFSDVKKMVLIK